METIRESKEWSTCDYLCPLHRKRDREGHRISRKGRVSGKG